MAYKKNAGEGKIFVVTNKGYEKTPDKVKPERAIGKPVKGFERSVPVSWLNKGYVEEVEEKQCAGVTFAKELEDGTATDCNKKESIEKWNKRANDGKTD